MTVYASFDAQAQYQPADLMQRDADWVAPGVLSTSDLQVIAQSPAAMAVNVSGAVQGQVGGSAWLPNGYRLYNDSLLSLAIAAANATNPRIDIVIAAVNTNTNPYTPVVQVVTGTPGASPIAPTMPAGFVGIILAQVYVAANATSIVQANVTDLRTVAALKGANGIPYAVDTSVTANTVTASITPAPASYTDGLAVCVKIANTTTGAATLNLNGLGAVAIKNGDGTAVGSGDLVAGVPVTLRYVGGGSPAFIASGSGGISGAGNATTADVRAPKIFTSALGKAQTGTLVDNGNGGTVIPTTADQVLAAGIWDTTNTVKGDANFVAANLKAGVAMWGKTGTFTADATATAAQMLAGAIAYVNGAKITGTMPENGALNYGPSTAAQDIPAGHTTGGTISAVTGTATAAQILSGYTASSANGINMAGTAVAGTPFASGTATSSSTNTTTYYSDNGSGGSGVWYDLVVTGLTFTPSKIICLETGATTPDLTVLNSSDSLDTTYPNGKVLTAANFQTGGTVNASAVEIDGTGCYVTGSGFRIPVRRGSSSYKWYAYQ